MGLALGFFFMAFIAFICLMVASHNERPRYDWRDYEPKWTSYTTTTTTEAKPKIDPPAVYVPPVKKSESSYPTSSPTPPPSPSTYDMGFWS